MDLHAHEAAVEHGDGRRRRVPLPPHRPVGQVTRDLLATVRETVGPVTFDPRPQETPWSTPLDEAQAHATYDAGDVPAYFAAEAGDRASGPRMGSAVLRVLNPC